MKKRKTVSIHQPQYIPWLGYFEKIAKADYFVYLDNVQFSKNSFDNRNKIVKNGQETWLTIPLKTSGKFGELEYTHLEYAQKHWVKYHIDILNQAYGNIGSYKQYSRWQMVRTYYDNLSEIGGDFVLDTTYLVEEFSYRIGIINNLFAKAAVPRDTIFFRASDLDVTGSKTTLLVNICKELEADTYYSGVMGREYLDVRKFYEANIKVVFQDYTPPNNLSILHNYITYGEKWCRGALGV